MNPKYVTVSGHTVALDPSSREYAFLERLERESAKGSEALTALAYSHENPMLDTATHPTLGLVTKDTLDNPAYRAMTDLLFRQKLAEDGTSPNELAAQHTMTVADVAIDLGIHESAVRQAIAAQRLASWVKGGKHFMKPSTVESFRRTSALSPKRGPARPAPPPSPSEADEVAPGPEREGFFVRVGHSADGTLKIAGHREISAQRKVARNIVEGWIEHTPLLGVLCDGPDAVADFQIVHFNPKSRAMEIAHRGLFVRGRWQPMDHRRDRDARVAWRVWRALSADADNTTHDEAVALLQRFQKTMIYSALLEDLKVTTFDEVTVDAMETGMGSADPVTARRNLAELTLPENQRRWVAKSAKFESTITAAEYQALVALGAKEETLPHERPK